MLRYESELCKILFLLPQIRFDGWKLEPGIRNWEQGTGAATVSRYIRLTDNGYTNNVSLNSSPLTHSLI